MNCIKCRCYFYVEGGVKRKSCRTILVMTAGDEVNPTGASVEREISGKNEIVGICNMPVMSRMIGLSGGGIAHRKQNQQNT